jgi:hypothetical protein
MMGKISAMIPIATNKIVFVLLFTLVLLVFCFSQKSPPPRGGVDPTSRKYRAASAKRERTGWSLQTVFQTHSETVGWAAPRLSLSALPQSPA